MEDARIAYADIIDRERPVSERHAPMSRHSRAAQFAPFAALTGYDDLIRESERTPEARTELDESCVEALDRKLSWLLRRGGAAEAAFTCFVPDGRKAGGAYRSVTGAVVKYDPLHRSITLSGGETLPIDDIRGIECGGSGDAAVDSADWDVLL